MKKIFNYPLSTGKTNYYKKIFTHKHKEKLNLSFLILLITCEMWVFKCFFTMKIIITT